MSGGRNTNSWTILTPEENAAETLRPLAEGTEHNEESLTSPADSGAHQPAGGDVAMERSPVEEHLVSDGETAELIGSTSTEQHTSLPATVDDAPVPTSLEASGSFVPGGDTLSPSGGLPEAQAQSNPDPDSFSDSYTHITSSPDEPPASVLSTETLGEVDFTHEEEMAEQEGTLHQLNVEGLQQEGDEPDRSPGMPDRKLAGSSVVEKTEGIEKEGEPELRRRRRSLLAALEQIGRTEEEDEREEEFQVPQREDDSGLSVNKCILGAVILLGLGTIFFSGVFMDLDEESDYGGQKDSEVPEKQEWLNPEVPPPPVDTDSTELLNKLAKGSEQISVLEAQLQAQEEELKTTKGQAAEGAKERLRLEEMEKENSRLKTEMTSLPLLQKDIEWMKRELESVPALKKELETLRSTVTELKRSSAASEAYQVPVKPTTSPPSGQPGDNRHDQTTGRQARKPWNDHKERTMDLKQEKYDPGEKKERKKSEWKNGEKKERKDGGKTEWKKEKHEQVKYDKVKDKEGKQKTHSDETKQRKENEWKKEKLSRGDEGKPWKSRDGKKEWIEHSERKDWKEVKDWKRDKVYEGKQEKAWERGKDYGEKHKGREEWKGEKEWKKVKDGFKERGKEKWEDKNWKEKGEKKEWKKDGEWRSKNGNKGKGKGERKQWDNGENHHKERKERDERKQLKENDWKSKNGRDNKEWKRKDERKQWKENDWEGENGRDNKEWKRKDERKQWEKKEEDLKRGQREDGHSGDWKKDKSSSQKHKDTKHKMSGNHHHDHGDEEQVWGDSKAPLTHRRPSIQQPEYWVKQRHRLQRNPKPPQRCDSVQTCAQTEGLTPVAFPEFEAILSAYLAKTEEVGLDASKREELKKLSAEFFKDGLFVHDEMSFQDFVEDVGDILEDMVEGDEDGDEADSAIEDEMDEFEREVMKKFSVPAAGGKEEGIQGDWERERGRGQG